jgi:hypothetical protein
MYPSNIIMFELAQGQLQRTFRSQRLCVDEIPQLRIAKDTQISFYKTSGKYRGACPCLIPY